MSGQRLEDLEEALAEARILIRDNRTRCLWFLSEDDPPEDVGSVIAALGQIERHGDLDAFRKARRLREWLSQLSSARSAGSSGEAGSSRARAT